MSRNCGMCVHEDRAALEARVLNGEPIAIVAVDAGLSVTALHRHRRNHLRPAMRVSFAARQVPTHVADFAAQLVELAEDATDVREYARQSGNPDLLLRAAASKRDTLLTLANHFGVDSSLTVSSLLEARDALRALVSVLPNHPKAFDDLLAVLRVDGQAELADALAGAVGYRAVRPIEQTKSPTYAEEQ